MLKRRDQRVATTPVGTPRRVVCNGVKPRPLIIREAKVTKPPVIIIVRLG